MEPDRTARQGRHMRLVGVSCLALGALLLSQLSPLLALPVWVLVGWHVGSLLRQRSQRREAAALLWEVGAWSSDPVGTMAAFQRVTSLPRRERTRVLRALASGDPAPSSVELPVEAVEAYRRSLATTSR